MTAIATGRRQINLTFHGIGEPPGELTPGEDAVWISVDRFEAILDQVRDHRDVNLTFDDGNISDIRYALPELKRRGLAATFFVVAGRLGQANYLAEQDVRALVAAGMQVGCHGMEHRGWRGLTDEHLRDELQAARAILEKTAGHPVTSAACPFGLYDRRVLRALREYGYKRVFTSDDGIAKSASWLQARNTITKGTAANTLDYVLAQEKLIPRTIRTAKGAAKRWR